ncbi:hypothetical protein ABWK22_02680 [Gottfriedia acidiceleris]|uniref:hypothetical protein n=1 Tax=Gottfriedia acidiceleris TaxID=371036 RepID=UPI003394CC0C
MAISPPTQANGSMDYEEMTKTVKYLLDAAWGPKWGSFTPDGPNVTDETNVEYPIILHYISEMRPGLIGKNTRELKPRHRYSAINEDLNGTLPPVVKIYGQVFDAEVVFEIWEETNAKVDKLTKEFRQTLSTYTGFLKEKGLKELQFLRMETDLSNSKIRDSHKIRRLVYFVRFEELTEVPTDIFHVIDVVEKKLQEVTKTQLGE